MSDKNFLQKIISHIKTLFLQGLFTILPILLTVFIATFTYEFLSRWLAPLRQIEPLYLQKIPGSEFILVVLFLLLVGFLLKLFFISPIIHWGERLIEKIPFVRGVYSASKTLVDFFKIPDPASKARKVVLVEFPRKGLFNIAFLLEPATNNFAKLLPEHLKESGKTYYKIFMPNSPNPTSGYFIIANEDEIIHTDMTFEEAIKTVVSCGLITPESLKRL